MDILHFDHVVLTVHSIAVTVEFYTRVLGMQEVRDGERIALHFQGGQINLHEIGREREPHASHPTPGSTDLCFSTATPIAAVLDELIRHGVPLLEGPVQRTGAHGDALYLLPRP